MSEQPSVEVFSLEVGPFPSNCHFIHPVDTDAVLLVDPGDDAASILDVLQTNRWRVAAYLLTHGHMDHVGALAEVAARHPAPIGLHPRDGAWAFTIANTMPPYFNEPPRAAPIDRNWQDGQRWTDSGLAYEILETPGHSGGSVSFLFKDHGLLFSGDVLFANSIGRSDLPGGDAQTLARSLQRLLTLPDATRVYPGHGPATTIGRERARNPFLRDFSWAG